MNKQPFYHAAEIDGDEKYIVKAIKELKGVVKSSVEYFNGELLFTATSDVSEEANNALMTLKNKGLIKTIPALVDAEPGDPSDFL